VPQLKSTARQCGKDESLHRDFWAERLTAAAAHNKTGGLFFDGPAQ
jgi:hypothetical protein